MAGPIMNLQPNSGLQSVSGWCYICLTCGWPIGCLKRRGQEWRRKQCHNTRWGGWDVACSTSHISRAGKIDENTIITRQMVQTDNAACWPSWQLIFRKSQFQNVWEFWTIVSFSSLPHRLVYHIFCSIHDGVTIPQFGRGECSTCHGLL